MTTSKKYVQDDIGFEICPVCEETLSLYSTKDVLTGQKIYRCRYCFNELVHSAIGWILKE